MPKWMTAAQDLLDRSRALDFVAPLLLRAYLVPVFWMAGSSKFKDFDATVEWFGNPDWGLGLPFPALLAFLAAGSELLGSVLLAVGLGVRLITLPLMATMIVAIFTVHIEHGWLAIAEYAGPFATERTMMAIERLNEAKDILREHGDYEHLTDQGSLVILNNGVEFAVTYLIMLLSLFFTGAGRYLSIDYWIQKRIATV